LTIIVCKADVKSFFINNSPFFSYTSSIGVGVVASVTVAATFPCNSLCQGVGVGVGVSVGVGAVAAALYESQSARSARRKALKPQPMHQAKL
jgi:hypothetical protein